MKDFLENLFSSGFVFRGCSSRGMDVDPCPGFEQHRVERSHSPIKAEVKLLLDEVLAAAVELQKADLAIQNADFGILQLYNPEHSLEIVAQQGFQQDFLMYFADVHDETTACGRAMKQHRRVIIEDVERDADFEPHRASAASAGFRAVQATPLFGRSGEQLGAISTQFGTPRRPTEDELRLTDLYAVHAAQIIERERNRSSLAPLPAGIASADCPAD